MIILGIETSCDETAASLVRDGCEVLSNVIASQDALHVEFGGVVPEIASRAHAERIIPIMRQALSDAGAGWNDVDAVAVGNRPGLIGSLLVGVTAAKAVSWSRDVPLIGADHVQSHLYAGCLESELPEFPALGLVVSGGHTNLYRCRHVTDAQRIGRTIDDAVGEAFDKAAVLLGLQYPGGAALDVLARDGNDKAFDFPVSMLKKDSLDFSFSGLKTSVLYTVRGIPSRIDNKTIFPRDGEALDQQERANVAASFQRAAISAIMRKVRRAVEQSDVRYKSLLVGGGVSANSVLRTDLAACAKEYELDLRLPALRYCLDNAAMIAGFAFHLHHAGRVDDLSLRALPTTASQ